MFRILVFLLTVSLTYSQVNKKQNNYLEYQTFITEEEVSSLIENLETDTTLKEIGFSLVTTKKSWEIYKNDTLFAVLSKIPQSSLVLENCDEIIPLFELRCIEKRSGLFGALVIFENQSERLERIKKVEQE
jgi:hypothetical protein